MNVLSLCTGIGGLDLGIKLACPEARTVGCCEIDAYCRAVLLARMAEGRFDACPIWDDLRLFDGKPWRGAVDTIAAGFPCFVAGTCILTWEGYRPIESLAVGDRVLTHTGQWRPVTRVMCRQATTTRTIRGQGFPAITTTDEHPFFVRQRGRQWDNEARLWRRKFGDPEWRDARELDNACYVSQVLPVEPIDCGKEDGDWWWLIGRYLADGWRNASGGKGRVVICAAHSEADAVEERISRVFPCCRSTERTVVKFHITRTGFHEWMGQFGRGAGGKVIPGWVLSLPVQKAAALLDGYLTGDGSRYRNRTGEGGGWKATTISRPLALGIALLAQRAWGVIASIHEYSTADTTIIEGREVRQQRQYQVVIPDRNRSAFVEGDHGWKLVRSNEPGGPAEVWNISVAGDESYVADGVIVHNCQDISNAGRREGIREGNRSGLWYEIERIIGEVGPRYVFVENVSALLTRGVGIVLGDLSRLGFDTCWGIVSAADVGAPHLRKRLFILAMADARRAGRGPDALPGGGGGEGADGEGQAAGGPGERGLALADSGGERLEGDGEAGAAAGPVGRGGGAVVADAARHLRRASGDGRSFAPDGTGDRPFPPGPGDAAGWRDLLARRPDLAPAVERPLRGDVARIPHRMDRLRALGNAVCPAQAAAAFTELMRRVEQR